MSQLVTITMTDCSDSLMIEVTDDAANAADINGATIKNKDTPLSQDATKTASLVFADFGTRATSKTNVSVIANPVWVLPISLAVMEADQHLLFVI